MITESNHLTDEQLAELLEGTRSPSADEHLRTCTECRHEASSLGLYLGAMRQQIGAVPPRPENFWTRQLQATLTLQPARPHTWRPALAAAAVVIALAATLLLSNAQPEVPATTARANVPAEQSDEFSDNALLSEVERTLQVAAPAALQPAALIAEELMVSTRRVAPAQVRKEKRDEI